MEPITIPIIENNNLVIRKYTRTKPVTNDKYHAYFRNHIKDIYRNKKFHEKHLKNCKNNYYKNIYSNANPDDKWVKKISFNLFD